MNPITPLPTPSEALATGSPSLLGLLAGLGVALLGSSIRPAARAPRGHRPGR